MAGFQMANGVLGIWPSNIDFSIHAGIDVAANNYQPKRGIMAIMKFWERLLTLSRCQDLLQATPLLGA
jgi:hypothetical protein